MKIVSCFQHSFLRYANIDTQITSKMAKSKYNKAW
jgi:hypothetical protein